MGIARASAEEAMAVRGGTVSFVSFSDTREVCGITANKAKKCTRRGGVGGRTPRSCLERCTARNERGGVHVLVRWAAVLSATRLLIFTVDMRCLGVSLCENCLHTATYMKYTDSGVVLPSLYHYWLKHLNLVRYIRLLYARHFIHATNIQVRSPGATLLRN